TERSRGFAAPPRGPAGRLSRAMDDSPSWSARRGPSRGAQPQPPETLSWALAELGESLSSGPLALDAAGELELHLEQGLSVQLALEPEHQALLMLGVAGPLPVPVEAARLLALLQANFGWLGTAGATLSV